jgi:signal transduction histidine kinase
LQEAPDPEERQMMLNHLETVATRLDETLHNLNEVVSIQQNENLQIETLELNEYIQKTLLLLQAQIAFKKANIRCDIPTGVAVQYNPAYLESILFNFVSNALKYSHPDRIPDISLHFFDTAGCGVLQISDNGMGIDLEKNGDKLFGMYKTFHGNADAKGLGLFISKNQIEAMGGSVEVESKVNVGTTFTIYFK